MPKIEGLIKEKCPNGVSYKRIGDVCSFVDGYPFKRSELNDCGVPVIRTSDLKNGFIRLDDSLKYDGDFNALARYETHFGDIVIGMSGTIKVAKNTLSDVCLLNQRVGAFRPKDEQIINDYLLFVLMENINDLYTMAGSGTVKNLSKVALMDYLIPVPPLDIQKEIANALNSFTELETELEIELKRELEARRKQYEYYRDRLLSFEKLNADGERVERFLLSDIAEYSKQRIDCSDLDQYSFVGVDNMLQNKLGKTSSEHVPSSGKCTRYDKDDILLGNIRPYLKKIWLADSTGGASGDVLVVHIVSDKINADYLYYVMSSDAFFEYDNSKSKGAKMPRGDKTAIMNYSFAAPPLNRQKQIVNILKDFERLVVDIESGISTEIEGRRKQYEYYRNKLLTLEAKTA